MLKVAMYICYVHLSPWFAVVPGADVQPGEPSNVQCGVSMDTGGGEQGGPAWSATVIQTPPGKGQSRSSLILKLCKLMSVLSF